MDGLADGMENSDHQEAVIMQEQPMQAVEVSSENPPIPEPAPSTSVKSTLGLLEVQTLTYNNCFKC
jgi:hypothetical protein